MKLSFGYKYGYELWYLPNKKKNSFCVFFYWMHYFLSALVSNYSFNSIFVRIGKKKRDWIKCLCIFFSLLWKQYSTFVNEKWRIEALKWYRLMKIHVYKIWENATALKMLIISIRTKSYIKKKQKLNCCYYTLAIVIFSWQWKYKKDFMLYREKKKQKI